MTKPESSKCSVTDARTPSPAPIDEQEQSFEFELPENIERVATPIQSTEEDIPPRFQDFQHPYVKLWVKFLALFSLSCLIYNGYYNFTRQYQSVLCPYVVENVSKCHHRITFFEVLEMVTHVVLEIVIPMILIFFCIFVGLMFISLPKLATKFRDPTPAFTPMVAVLIVYYCVTYLGYSMSMVSNLTSTSRPDVWLQYFTTTMWGVFWMYSLINIQVFSKLSTFEQIRAKEKWETLELARAQALA